MQLLSPEKGITLYQLHQITINQSLNQHIVSATCRGNMQLATEDVVFPKRKQLFHWGIQTLRKK